MLTIPSHQISQHRPLKHLQHIGETIVLSRLPTFIPKLQAASAGRYGAFLFAAYALVLGIAEVITLKAAP
jgi:hypothetical protein